MSKGSVSLWAYAENLWEGDGQGRGGDVFPGIGAKGSFRFHKVSDQLMFLIFPRSGGTREGKGKLLFLLIKQYPWPLCRESL